MSLVFIVLFANCNENVKSSEFKKFQFPKRSYFFADLRDSANVKVGKYQGLILRRNDDPFPFMGFSYKALFYFSDRILKCNVVEPGYNETLEICDFNLPIGNSKSLFENDPLLKKRRKIMTLHNVYNANNDTFYFFENNYPDEILKESKDKNLTLSYYYIVSMKNGVLGERFGLVDTTNKKIYFSKNGTKGVFDELYFYNNDFVWEKVKFL